MLYTIAMNKILDNVINTASKTQVIRLFISRDEGFKASGRHVALLTGMTPPTAHHALKELLDLGVLEREIIGKQHIYSLNTVNHLVKKILKPMFLGESALKKDIEIHLGKHSHKKNVYIIAGSNGSGKTTFAKSFLPDYAKCKNFVNSDLIAQGLSPFFPQAAALRAGRLVLEQIESLSGKGFDFGFETTLSGKFYIQRLKELKQMGYSLHLFFLWISTADLAIERIKDRVSYGGHHVPSEDVRRRFLRGLHNFFRFYRPLLNSWMLLGNSLIVPRLIAKELNNDLIVSDKDLFETISKIAR